MIPKNHFPAQFIQNMCHHDMGREVADRHSAIWIQEGLQHWAGYLACPRSPAALLAPGKQAGGSSA